MFPFRSILFSHDGAMLTLVQERLCLPPPSPGLYNAVTRHPAPSSSAPSSLLCSASSAPPTPASSSQLYPGYTHKTEGGPVPGGRKPGHHQQHTHQHHSYQAFNSFPHSAGIAH